MQISEVLSIHRSFETKNSHTDILGDAFLMQTNPVYRNIKTEALKIGCHYAEAWPEYLLMPFHALGEIVASKKIPYAPSARLLQNVEDKRANALSVDDISIPPSYHLHEAAHVIADHLFDHHFDDPHEKILKAIVCESFANAVDALACVSATDDMHRFFLQHNCYMYPHKKSVSLIARMIKTLGYRFTFIYAVMAYVHSNFLKETIPQRLIKDLGSRYAPDVKLTEKILKDCEAFRKIADSLDPLFRYRTTQMYLKLEGYDGEVEDLLDFPFMKVFDVNPIFRKTIEAMADVLGYK